MSNTNSSSFSSSTSSSSSSSPIPSAPLSWPTYPDDAYANERRRIQLALQLFDKEKKGVILKEDVGTMMRSLGAYPSESDLVTLILPSLTRLDSPTTLIPTQLLIPFLLHALVSHNYDPDSETLLLAAFRTLDVDGKGYLDESSLREWLGENEYGMREKELEDMMRVAKDPDTGFIHYEGQTIAINRLSSLNMNIR